MCNSGPAGANANLAIQGISKKTQIMVINLHHMADQQNGRQFGMITHAVFHTFSQICIRHFIRWAAGANVNLEIWCFSKKTQIMVINLHHMADQQNGRQFGMIAHAVFHTFSEVCVCHFIRWAKGANVNLEIWCFLKKIQIMMIDLHHMADQQSGRRFGMITHAVFHTFSEVCVGHFIRWAAGACSVIWSHSCRGKSLSVVHSPLMKWFLNV
jgi:uncharacterized protein YlbG (UPF0298 family)